MTWWWLPLPLGLASVLWFLAAPQESAPQTVAFFVPLMVATALLVFRAFAATAEARASMRVLAVSVAGYTASTLVWYLGPVAFDQPLPFPSPVDAAFFCSYLGFAAFLVLVLRRTATDKGLESRLALSDALLATVAAAAVLWVWVIQPSTTTQAPVLTLIATTLYPVFTLILLALAVRLAARRRLTGSLPGVLLLSWVGCEIVSDTMYAIQSASGNFAYGTPLSAAWMLGYTALGAFAAHPGIGQVLAGETSGPAATPSPVVEVLDRVARRARVPLLATLASAPLLLAMGGQSDIGFLLVAGIAAVVLVTYRASLFAGDLRRERSLTEQLDLAMVQLRAQHEELAAQSAALEHQASHDLVTGLGNRTLLRRRTTEWAAQGVESSLLLVTWTGSSRSTTPSVTPPGTRC